MIKINYPKKNFNIFFIIIPCVLLAIIGSFHEIWRDEGEHIQVATELNFKDLFLYTGYIGQSPIYHICLKILFFLLGNKIYALKLFNLIIFFIGATILIKSKNLPFLTKFLIIFSYPIFAEYGLINRPYIIFFPLLSYLILYKKKNKHFEVASLLILSGIQIFGLIISLIYLMSEYKVFIQYFKKNKLIFFFSFLIVAIFILFFYFPINLEPRNWANYEYNNILVSFLKILSAFFYIPDFNGDIISWQIINSNYKIRILIFFFSIIYLLVFNFLLINNKDIKSIFFFNFSFVIFAFALSIQERGDYRHLFILYIVSLIIYSKNLNVNKKDFMNNFSKIILYINLINSFVFTVFFIFNEIKYNFSNGYEVYKYIQENHIKCSNIISYPNHSSNSWSPYLNNECKTYDVGNKKFSSFNYSNNNGLQKFYSEHILSVKNFKYIVTSCNSNCLEEEEYYLKSQLKNEIDKIIFFNKKVINNYENFLIIKKN